MGELLTPEERLNYLYGFCKFDEKPLTFDFWQDMFLKSNSRFICLLKSRRVGYSFVTPAKGLVKAMDPNRTKYIKQFVSYNESDAMEKINYAREFYESIPKQHRKRIVTGNKTELEFLDSNGKTTSRLISMPCRPPRGKGGDISLDEFGIFLPRMSNLIYQAALPVISRGGCIEVGSTPLGCIGKFYEICTDKKKFKSFQRIRIPWYFAHALCSDVEQAIRTAEETTTAERVERFGTEIIREIFGNCLIEDFQQEYECEFVDTAESYIPMELIYANTPGMRAEDLDFSGIILQSPKVSSEWNKGDDDYINNKRDVDFQVFKSADDLIARYDPALHGTLYIGYDVARTRDAAVVHVIGRVDGGKKRSVADVEMHNKEFEYQLNVIRQIKKRLPVRRIAIDMTGMGLPLEETLRKEYGDAVEGITFNIENKEVLAMSAKIGLEKREFLLPNERDFHAQIHSIRRIAASGGHFRYDAQRDEKGHADRFWAWALANYAATSVSEMHEQNNFYSRRKIKTDKSMIDLKNKVSDNTQAGTRRRRGKSLAAIERSFTRHGK